MEVGATNSRLTVEKPDWSRSDIVLHDSRDEGSRKFMRGYGPFGASRPSDRTA